MTDRERFRKQMQHEPVGHYFNMEFGYWQDNFEQWPIFRENGITNNEDADIFSSSTAYTRLAVRGCCPLLRRKKSPGTTRPVF